MDFNLEMSEWSRPHASCEHKTERASALLLFLKTFSLSGVSSQKQGHVTVLRIHKLHLYQSLFYK